VQRHAALPAGFRGKSRGGLDVFLCMWILKTVLAITARLETGARGRVNEYH